QHGERTEQQHDDADKQGAYSTMRIRRRPAEHSLAASLHRPDDSGPGCEERGCARRVAGWEEAGGLGIIGEGSVPLEYRDDALEFRKNAAVIGRIGETYGRVFDSDENVGYGAVRILAADHTPKGEASVVGICSQ